MRLNHVLTHNYNRRLFVDKLINNLIIVLLYFKLIEHVAARPT